MIRVAALVLAATAERGQPVVHLGPVDQGDVVDEVPVVAAVADPPEGPEVLAVLVVERSAQGLAGLGL